MLSTVSRFKADYKRSMSWPAVFHSLCCNTHVTHTCKAWFRRNKMEILQKSSTRKADGSSFTGEAVDMSVLQTINSVKLQDCTAHYFGRRPLRRTQLGSCQRWACALDTQKRRRLTSLRCPVLAAVVAERAKPAARMPTLPFVKIAGQEDMKLAILLNVIDPKIGGVLIMGERGTGKSVAVRAMVDLLPEIDVVPDDPFNSSPTDTNLMGPGALQVYRSGEKLPSGKAKTPLVELPLGATEDRICGTIDIEKALQEGIKAYEPGLLARANRGILYVDEVNLLDDGLVDVVLDSAASGLNTVEREGVSIIHPAKFIMLGSGNPQEGELRPQLLDRFGMSVNVTTLLDVEVRTQMVLDKMAYEQDPDDFCYQSSQEQGQLRQRLVEATKKLKGVHMPPDVQLKISEVCSLLDVDGIRGDIVTNRAAKALVAFEGREEVSMTDVEKVIGLCLNHRLRKDPLDPMDGGSKVKLAVQRINRPKEAAEADKAKKEAAEKKQAAAANSRSGKKAGSWGGLP